MERPILFSTPMVKAILDGRKTQTRRIIKPQPIVDFDSGYVFYGKHQFDIHDMPLTEDLLKYCRYGKPGDTLWVRETWQWIESCPVGAGYYVYKASSDIDPVSGWKPSIHMPKEACRIKLLVKDIRVERLQDISEEDAKVEGCEKAIKWIHTGKIEVIDTSHVFYHHSTHKDGYEMLWEAINGKGSWEKNLWVWVIGFERCR